MVKTGRKRNLLSPLHEKKEKVEYGEDNDGDGFQSISFRDLAKGVEINDKLMS